MAIKTQTGGGLHRTVCLILVFVSASLIHSGCGLPAFSTLPKPIVNNYESQWNLGFTTPEASIGTVINGYALYYKIYISNEDFDKENDASYFEERKDSKSKSELQPGDVVPRKRNYVRVGKLNVGSFPTLFTVPHDKSGVRIMLDFKEGVDDPVVKVGTSEDKTGQTRLARGFIDPRSSNRNFRRFVKDWFFSATKTDLDFFDGDLRRPPGKQPGSRLEDFTGTPILLDKNSPHNPLIVSFVAYSVGIDPTSGSPTPIFSKPVYLGKIEYSNIVVNRKRKREG